MIEEDESVVQRHPKHRVAILFGYNGAGFHGLSFDPKVLTVETSLFQALIDAKLVLPSNSTNPSKVGINRAGRTDKGVHAARQVVSIKLECPRDKTMRELVQLVNSFLVPEIRVWNIQLTTQKFDARHYCDSRKYEYCFPSFCLDDPDINAYYHSCHTQLEEPAQGFDPADVPIMPTDSQISFRISMEKFEGFSCIISAFNGSHNFHNFTVERHFKEDSSRRFMKKVTCELFVHDYEEWVRVSLHAHQIRKMIGFAILAIRSNQRFPLKILEQLFGPTKVTIPQAPALGLFMDEPIFSSYNMEGVEKIPEPTEPPLESKEEACSLEKPKRYKKPNSGKGKRIDAGRDMILFDAFEPEIIQFRNDQIYKMIFAHDRSENAFAKWIQLCDRYSFWFLGIFNSRGIVTTGRAKCGNTDFMITDGARMLLN